MKRPSFLSPVSRRARVASALALALLFAGCTSPTHRAPVEDRAAPRATASATTAPAAASAEVVKPPPGIENLGKPGYYAVKPGDTMIRVGLETGQNWRDIARWNNIDNPNLLEVGQVLRVVAPGTDATAAATKPVANAGTKIESRPLDSKPAAAVSAPVAGNSSPVATTMPVAAPAAREADDDLAWTWPTSGPVTVAFDEVRTKGLVFGGKAGDAVLAAADGRVIYVGSGVRGYGNMIIVKHNASYLTAYGHNQALLVKEDQVVRKGQKIAEMGSSDADRVQLHFEIRRLGKPLDPAKLLPPR